jgi:Bifunctional DNA primase/polymerase, N-terminal
MNLDLMLAAALEYVQHHWEVFPLRGKVPAIPKPHLKDSPEYRTCKGECGQPGHGVLDATTDIDQITQWWTGDYAGANIGGRVPKSMFVLDTDPYHGGLESLATLEAKFSKLPQTLTDYSGREDGGAHYFYRRPPGTLSATRLGPGIDIKTSGGYVVLPPSVHPVTGKPYTRIEHPVAAPPDWLITLLLPRPAPPRSPHPQSRRRLQGPSIADAFNAATSWADILCPHGWAYLAGDPDGDGAVWLHPAATSKCSATVRHGCLFVYTPNTPFKVYDEDPNRKGYTKFRAYALLNHNGDMSAAARHLKGAA